MRRRVKYDNAQRGSKVRAKLPARAAETHQSRLRREHAEQTTAWLLTQRGKGQRRCAALPAAGG